MDFSAHFIHVPLEIVLWLHVIATFEVYRIGMKFFPELIHSYLFTVIASARDDVFGFIGGVNCVKWFNSRGDHGLMLQ